MSTTCQLLCDTQVHTLCLIITASALAVLQGSAQDQPQAQAAVPHEPLRVECSLEGQSGCKQLTRQSLSFTNRQQTSKGSLNKKPGVVLSMKDLMNSGFTSSKWNVVSTSTHNKPNSQLVTMIGPNGTSQAIMKVTYPKGSIDPGNALAPHGGVSFSAAPKSTFPTRSVHVKYSVKFENNFDWVRGRKLPGIWVDNMGAAGCNLP